ncbi:MAG: hypothetical protein QNJ70_06550 [Xenococcaceae cyanobacterium MO_207.B15]|nr:hypothetical protein [Xenococcaceae cyanobacterium MO_207.B15]MDJ0745101.1 hypothetical protein [Xenococcaceae cyanobacterium MO_167.B27]
MYSIPDYLTYYYEEGNIRFKNICSYDNVEAQAVLTNLSESGQRTWLHPGYLEERREIETWLYNDFVKKGKKPYLNHPIYFVLGEHDDLFQKGGFFSSANPIKLKIPLSLFDSNQISFTYPDSMPSFNIPRVERGKPYLKPFHGQVFTKDEITEVVQTYGLPGDRWKVEEAWRYDRFIEAQIWDVRPIEKFLET